MDRIKIRIERSADKWVDDALVLSVPSTLAELRKAVYFFAGGNLTVMNIDKEKIVALQEKCKQVREGTLNSSLKELPEADRLVELLTKYEQAFQSYREGNVWEHINRDVGQLRATLDARDVRSVGRGVGMEYEQLNKLKTPEARKLLSEYSAAGFLGPDTIEFLAQGVPIETLEYFLSLFTVEQLHIYRDVLNSSVIAKSLVADSGNSEYVECIAKISLALTSDSDTCTSATLDEQEFKQYYPDLDWTKSQYTFPVLLNALPGNAVEKQECISKYIHEKKLRIEDLVRLVKLPTFTTDGAFDELCVEYADVFEPRHTVFLLSKNIDLEYAREVYKVLPEIMQDVAYIVPLLEKKAGYTRERLDEFIACINLEIEEEVFSGDMLVWFFESYDATRPLIQKFKEAKVRSLGYIHELCTDARIPVEYSLMIHTKVNEYLPETVHMKTRMLEWHMDGVTDEIVSSCSGLWNTDKGVMWYQCDSETVKAYAELQKEPEKVKIVEFICATYDKVPSEIAIQVQQGYSRDVCEAVAKLDLNIPWYDIFKEFTELPAECDALSDEKKGLLFLAVLDGKRSVLESALREGKSIDEILNTMSFTVEKPPQTIEIVKNKHEVRQDAKEKIYEKFFDFFEISPEYRDHKMALSSHEGKLNDVYVNHILLCAYIENLLPEKAVKLVEKYGITNFTRYPLEVLQSMSEEYSSDADSKKERVAISLIAKSDWNGALDDESGILNDSYKDHQVYVYEVGSRAEFFRSMREFGEEQNRKGKKISLVMVGGHGNEKVVQLGFPYTATSTELFTSSVRLLAPLKRFLAADGQVVLSSCSAAGTKEKGDNFATTLAKTWTGVEVFAANANVFTEGITFDSDGRVVSVEYSKPHAMEVIKK